MLERSLHYIQYSTSRVKLNFLVMFLPRFVCLLVSLSVGRVTQKVIGEFYEILCKGYR